MKERISTVTNIAYAIVGFLRWNPLTTPAFFVLFASSTAFHWTKAVKAQTSDVLGMFLVFNALIASALVDAGMSIWVGAGFVLVATIWMSIFRRAFVTIPTLGLQLLILTMIKLYIGASLLFLPVLALAMVFNIPFLYREEFEKLTGITLTPFMIDMFHGVWHIVSAIGLYLA